MPASDAALRTLLSDLDERWYAAAGEADRSRQQQSRIIYRRMPDEHEPRQVVALQWPWPSAFAPGKQEVREVLAGRRDRLSPVR